ncbi:MAG TPA: phage holin family protein [Xanthobacteraceae bacterium]|nr:phage holin family protein [Xanthobacteraceae bacterium]
MAPDSLRDSALVNALTDLMADLSDLIQKEVRLARAEIAHKMTIRLRAAAWFAVAGLFAVAAFLLIIEAAVFTLVSAGLGLPWSCVVIAALLVVLAAIAFAVARARGSGDIVPTRTARQFNEIMKTAKEQMS